MNTKKITILDKITGSDKIINKGTFLQPPITWVNDETQLNANNLNKLSVGIKNVQDEFNATSIGLEDILSDIVTNNAGWKSAESENGGEIFNDYEQNKVLSNYASAFGTQTQAGKFYLDDGITQIIGGLASAAFGLGTVASSNYQMVLGKWNLLDEESDQPAHKYALIIGNGESDNIRSNAFTVDWDGNGEFHKDLIVTEDANVGNDVIVGNDLHVVNNTYIKGYLDVKDNITVAHNLTLGTNGSDNHTIYGKTCFQHAVRSHSNLKVDGNVSLGSSSKKLEVYAPSEFNENVKFTGSENDVTIEPKLNVTGDAQFNALTASGSTSLKGTEIGGNLVVVGNIKCNNEDEEEPSSLLITSQDIEVSQNLGEDNIVTISLVDEHNHLDYVNLTVEDGEERTVPNAIAYAKGELIGTSSITSEKVGELEVTGLTDITIHGVANYALNLVKNLLNAYILDNDNPDDPTAADAIDKLIEIANWIKDDKAGAAKYISDLQNVDRLVREGIQGWDDAYAAMHSHSNSTELNLIKTGDVAKWNAAHSVMHDHDNSAALDLIDEDSISSWNAAHDDMHSHGNSAELDLIKTGDVQSWNDAMHSHSDLAALDLIDEESIESWNQAATSMSLFENLDAETVQTVLNSGAQINTNKGSIQALEKRISDLESALANLIAHGQEDPNESADNITADYYIRYED